MVEGQVLRLTSLDRANYLQALDTLRPLGRPLNLAISEYADVVNLLPQGTSLREVVTDFTRRNNTVRESRTVPQLVAEYIAAKEKANKSEGRTCATCVYGLPVLARCSKCQLHMLLARCCKRGSMA